jgi:hypothetical protein
MLEGRLAQHTRSASIKRSPARRKQRDITAVFAFACVEFVIDLRACVLAVGGEAKRISHLPMSNS